MTTSRRKFHPANVSGCCSMKKNNARNVLTSLYPFSAIRECNISTTSHFKTKLFAFKQKKPIPDFIIICAKCLHHLKGCLCAFCFNIASWPSTVNQALLHPTSFAMGKLKEIWGLAKKLWFFAFANLIFKSCTNCGAGLSLKRACKTYGF